MIPNGIYFRQNLIEIYYTPLGLFNLVPVLIYGRSDERKKVASTQKKRHLVKDEPTAK
jgi:hypothetical protein